MSTEQVDIVVTESGAAKARDGISGIGDAADKTAHSVEGLGHGVSLLTELFAALGLAMGVKELIAISDSYTQLQNQLKLVSKNSEELLHTQEELLHIANDTRQSMEGTVALYSSLAIATKNLHTSHESLLSIVTTVNQALTISGKSADEVTQAMRRFATSMAQGTLDSRGITTVLMQFPALARAIADGLNIDVGSLKAMAAQGTLTARDVTVALERSASSVQKLFEQMTPTIGQAFTVLKNEVDETIGKMLSAEGAGSLVSASILALAHNVETVIKVFIVLAATLAAYTAATVVARISSISLFAIFAANPITATVVAVTALTAAFIEFGSSIKLSADGSVTAMSALIGVVRVTAAGLADLFQWATSSSTGLAILTVSAGVLGAMLVSLALNSALTFLASLSGAVWAVVAAMGTLVATLLTAVGAFALITGSILVAYAAYLHLTEGTDAANEKITLMVEKVKELAGEVGGSLVTSLKAAATATHEATAAVTDYTTVMSQASSTAGNTAKAISAAGGAATSAGGATGAALTSVSHATTALGGAITSTNTFSKNWDGTMNQLGSTVKSVGQGIETTRQFTQDWDGTMRLVGQTMTTVSNGVKTTTTSMVDYDGSLRQVAQSIETGLNPQLAASIGLLNSMTTAAGLATSAASAAAGDYAGLGPNAQRGGGGGGVRQRDPTNWTGGGSTDWSANATTNFSTGFATGGSFKVVGNGGTDSQRVSFMATPGEVVSIATPDQVKQGMPASSIASVSRGATVPPGSGGGVSIAAPISITLNLNGVTDAASYQANKSQIFAGLSDAILRASTQLGRSGN